MKGVVTLETWKLGPLEICVDYPLIFYHGKRLLGWRDRTIKLLAILIQNPIMTREELMEALACSGHSFEARLAEARSFLKVSGIGIAIAAVMAPDSKSVEHYRLIITEAAPKVGWIENRTPSDLIRGRSPTLSPRVRTLASQQEA